MAGEIPPPTFVKKPEPSTCKLPWCGQKIDSAERWRHTTFQLLLLRAPMEEKNRAPSNGLRKRRVGWDADPARKRRTAEVLKTARKRTASPPSASRCVRRSALTEPTHRRRECFGARSKPRAQAATTNSPADIMTRWQARFHHQPS